MKRTLALILLGVPVFAQKQELGFTIGHLRGSDRGLVLRSQGGTALQANYGYRVWENDSIAISAEVHFLASPLRKVTGLIDSTRDYASLYVTPAVRVKLHPRAHFQPYGAIGGGYALYEQSTTTLGGGPNPVARHIARGALMYGGGIDFPVRKWMGVRGEVRDFYTGVPGYTLNATGRQHNVVSSIGFVLRFGE
jgi:opacity protein-like surface antigen